MRRHGMPALKSEAAGDCPSVQYGPFEVIAYLTACVGGMPASRWQYGWKQWGRIHGRPGGREGGHTTRAMTWTTYAMRKRSIRCLVPVAQPFDVSLQARRRECRVKGAPGASPRAATVDC